MDEEEQHAELSKIIRQPGARRDEEMKKIDEQHCARPEEVQIGRRKRRRLSAASHATSPLRHRSMWALPSLCKVIALQILRAFTSTPAPRAIHRGNGEHGMCESTVRMANIRAETMRELEHAESPYCSGHSGPDDVGIRDQDGVHMIGRVTVNPSGEFSLGTIAL